ncbi:hypothetical protein SLEP1_g25732 [Rubroshorea leprosula]|uniref:Non-specific lipid-transfer protein n=1 Tax=Rubroshorea leprosula TaxID=152421 RepID=A0AAV5JQF4_9ROSI|nr:hypothetical protein SLEP1_g25732 [Rubroshorea leprosula]
MMGCWSWFLWILGLGIILAMVGSRCVHATISCSDAIVTLTRCKPFLTRGSRFPSVLCCVVLSNLNHEASTNQDRRDLCHCLKDAAPGFGVIPERAKELPQKCGVQIRVPIDSDIDCDTIPMQRGMN